MTHPLKAAEDHNEKTLVKVEFVEENKEESQRLADFLTKNIIIKDGKVVLTASSYEDDEYYECAQQIIETLNITSKATNQEFYYDVKGGIFLRDKGVVGNNFAFTGKYYWGYTTSFSAKDCEKIATYLAVGAGIATIIAALTAKYITGIPIALVATVAGALLTIGVVLFSAGARNNGVDMSYTAQGMPFWVHVNW